MAGPLKTLFGALQASSYITSNNVTIVFGNEEVNQQRVQMPYVALSPVGGQYDPDPGYSANADPLQDAQWEKAELVELWLYNASSVAGQQGGIDHADAVESLRQWVLSALYDQRAQYTDTNSIAYGLSWKPLSGRWETFGNAPSRFGRAYVLSIAVKITIPIAQQPSPQATIQTEQINFSIVNKPS